MTKRNYKNGYAISTFPSNNGYVTMLYGKYGEQLQIKFATNPLKAKANHYSLLESI